MSQDLLVSFLGDNEREELDTRDQSLTSIGSGTVQRVQATSSSVSAHFDLDPAQGQIDDHDDFGDFEGSTPVIQNPSTKQAVKILSHKARVEPSVIPPKALAKPVLSERPPDVETKHEKVGQHPFAGHWDVLFDTGDDEYDAGADELGDLSTNPEAAMAFSKRLIAQQEGLSLQATKSDVGSQYGREAIGGFASGPIKPQERPASMQSKDPNILFDADDLSGSEDDFGGFEEADGNPVRNADDYAPSNLTIPHASMPAIDLLGTNQSLYQAPSASTNGDPFQPNTATQPLRQEVQKAAVIRAETEDDSWDDLDNSAAWPNPTDTVQQAQSLPVSLNHPISISAMTAKVDALLPTNIPPPVALISLFPSILAQADETLFDAMGKLDLKQRQMLLGHPASHQFLKGYLNHCTVMAHIIAGRKLRWKRDQRLSQSMRIGPAAAGGKGGMKLAGLDKAESAKEDREVTDLLQLWKRQVGKLRTAVSAASSMLTATKLLPVPELAEQMPIKTLKPSEGGVTASNACALCGLKREERVSKVDNEVDDSFGEWWIQSMNMHAACKAFWAEFEKKLKSR